MRFLREHKRICLILIIVVCLLIAGISVFVRIHKKSETREIVSRLKINVYQMVLYTKLRMEIEEKINVFYIRSLETPELNVDYLSGERVRLKWKNTALAQKYGLYKYNAATGRYTLKKYYGKNDVILVREKAVYSVRAFADLGNKKIKSGFAKPVKVKSSGDIAKTYSSAVNLRAFNTSNLVRIATVTGSGASKTPQSMCFTGKHYVLSYVSNSGTAGKLIKYDRSGGIVAYQPASGIGFANGTACNPNKRQIYIVKTHADYKSRDCMVFDMDQLTYKTTVRLPVITSGIAYDESNDYYYLSCGAWIYVTDSDFNIIKEIRKKRWYHAQDVGAYNGVAFACSWKSSSESYIDMYRVSDGAYIGGYTVPIGEIESLVFDSGYMIILMNTVGSREDRLYRTTERFNFR